MTGLPTIAAETISAPTGDTAPGVRMGNKYRGAKTASLGTGRDVCVMIAPWSPR